MNKKERQFIIQLYETVQNLDKRLRIIEKWYQGFLEVFGEKEKV